MIAGAGRSTGSSALGGDRGRLPSSGRPSGSTTRPSSAGPTGTRTTSPVPWTAVAGLDRVRIVEQDAADRSRVQHLREAELPLVEAQQLVEPRVGQAGDRAQCRRRRSSTRPICVEPAGRAPDGVRAWRGRARASVRSERQASLCHACSVRADLRRDRRASCCGRRSAAPRSSRPAISAGSDRERRPGIGRRAPRQSALGSAPARPASSGAALTTSSATPFGSARALPRRVAAASGCSSTSRSRKAARRSLGRQAREQPSCDLDRERLAALCRRLLPRAAARFSIAALPAPRSAVASPAACCRSAARVRSRSASRGCGQDRFAFLRQSRRASARSRRVALSPARASPPRRPAVCCAVARRSAIDSRDRPPEETRAAARRGRGR